MKLNTYSHYPISTHSATYRVPIDKFNCFPKTFGAVFSGLVRRLSLGTVRLFVLDRFAIFFLTASCRDWSACGGGCRPARTLCSTSAGCGAACLPGFMPTCRVSFLAA